jgi:hypothetical protein
MHPRIFRISFVVARNAAIAVIAVAIIASCNMPEPSASEDQDSDSGPFATRQQSLGGAGESHTYTDTSLDCLEWVGPWTLSSTHMYDLTISRTTMKVNVEGTVPLDLDKNGNVTSGAGKGFGSMEGTSNDCTFYATWQYTAMVTGTCSGITMDLSIEELFGKGGAITGVMKCKDREPVKTYYGYPAMNHDISIELWQKQAGGTKTISWGTGGSGLKSWKVITGLEVVPLVVP